LTLEKVTPTKWPSVFLVDAGADGGAGGGAAGGSVVPASPPKFVRALWDYDTYVSRFFSLRDISFDSRYFEIFLSNRIKLSLALSRNYSS